MSEKDSFERKKNQVWPFFDLFLSSSSLPPKKSLKCYYITISLSWALAFFYRNTFLPLPPQNPLDHVNGLRRPWNMLSGDLKLHDHSNIISLGVNRSGPRTSSTTNHKFYKALGQPHGPWCKEPLSSSAFTKCTCFYSSPVKTVLHCTPEGWHLKQ